MVLLVAALLLYRSYSVYCPCGFKYDAFSGGCVVDLNAGPCRDQGGGNPPGHSSGGSASPAAPVVSTDFPTRCGLWVGYCGVRPDWKAAQFKLVNSSGTVPIGSPPKIPVTMKIAVRESAGGSCVDIKGTVDVPVDTLMDIPFDSGALAGSFPIASSSTSGTPPTGLLANIHEPCRGTLMQMVAFPVPEEGCGCKVSIPRD
jgi:hypothetical protein